MQIQRDVASFQQNSFDHKQQRNAEMRGKIVSQGAHENERLGTESDANSRKTESGHDTDMEAETNDLIIEAERLC